MKNLEILNDIPWRKEKEAFEAMAQIANVSNMTEEEKNRYDDALREYQDAYATHMFAAEDGFPTPRVYAAERHTPRIFGEDRS